jgi:hypothetical protein
MTDGIIMANVNQHKSVIAQIQALENMLMPELKEKWKNLNGNNAPPYNRRFLIKNLAYRIQELAFGGLPLEVEKRLHIVANIQNSTRKESERPVTGTRLLREFRGEEHQVTVLKDGFEYKGCKYDNLSIIARKITGTRWSGPLFFGLKRNLVK